jgi:uncharacterized caspase-like protein
MRIIAGEMQATAMAARIAGRLLWIGVLWWLSLAVAQAEKRVALVIGNAAYQHAPALANAANDSEAVARMFREAGFAAVEVRRDVGATELRRALRDFARDLGDADIAVVYYAGHGIEIDGTNYLIPVDAVLQSDFDVEDETVSLDRILKVLEPARQLRLVILDACRENPFARGMKRTGATRAIGRGLARVEPATADTLIAFAAKAGAVADDGRGPNSPYTSALVRHLAAPGVDLRIAFGRVRDDVMKATSNRQEPFVYGSLGGSTVALVPAPAAAAPLPVDPNAEARRDYEFAAQIGTEAAWASFLAAHPTGFFADLARAQSAKLLAAREVSAKAEVAKRQAEGQAARQAEQAKVQSADEARRQIEEATRQLTEAKRQAEEARRQVEEARRQAVAEAQQQVEEAKRRAEEQARMRVATAPAQPAATPQSAAVPAMDPADVARLLQAHLKRVGCDPGTTDGNWGDGSQKAMAQFNQRAGTKFDVKLASLDALDAVRARTGRVCPLVCRRGEREEGDQCVPITCPAGQVLARDGTCQKPREPKPVVHHEPRAPAAPAGGGKCFNFKGQRFCE